MEIFEREDERINFVDENNVFVGYELGAMCCEEADQLILDSLDLIPNVFAESWPWNGRSCEDVEKYQDKNLKGWVFDVDFIERKTYEQNEECFFVAFRIIKGDEEKFIILYNQHGGYYSHGFKVNVGGNMLKGKIQKGLQ